jgi:hypothetical protein
MMSVRGDARHPFALSLLFALLLSGCNPGGGPVDLGASGSVADGPVFRVCGSICVRPSDCQVAYPDDQFCPPGFLCSNQFACVSDGGGD